MTITASLVARTHAVRRTRRIRELGALERAGVWARGQVRRRPYGFVQARWRMLLAVAASAAVPVAGLALAAPTPFLRGTVVGGGTVGVLGLLATLVAQASGSTASAGAAAEQWTASELRMLRRAGWRVVNHVHLRRHDIDHVLVGPGGVVAVETKWSKDEWTMHPSNAGLQKAVGQVSRNAHDLSLLNSVRAAGLGGVTSTVFLWAAQWGQDAAPGAAPVRLGDTTVVRGTAAAKAWGREILRAPRRLGESQIESIWSELEGYVQRYDDAEARTDPAPPTLLSRCWTGVIGFAAVVGGMLSGRYGYVLTHSTSLWAAATLALAAAGAGAARRSAGRVRIAAIAFLVGLASVAAYVGVVVAWLAR